MKSIIVARDQQAAMAQRLSAELKLPLCEPHTVRFADSELRVMLEDRAKFKGAHAILVHSTSRPVHDTLTWLLMACHALRQAGIARLTAVVPYLGYGRQDLNPDGSLGAAHLVAQLFEAVGIDELISVELHVPEIVSCFTMPVHNVTLEGLIARFLNQQYEPGTVTLVAPDAGAHDRLLAVAQRMPNAPTMMFQKERFAINKTRIVASNGICETAHAVIVDDIIDTGSTVIDVGQALADSQPDCQVSAFAIHPVLSANAPDCLQDSIFEHVWMTNTIQLSPDKRFDKQAILDVSSAIAQVIAELL